MPNVVIVRNTYPDDQSMLRVIHYALDKAVTVGAYGTSPNVEAAYMQMQFVKRAFFQTDTLQLKHFFITYSHEEAAYAGPVVQAFRRPWCIDSGFMVNAFR